MSKADHADMYFTRGHLWVQRREKTVRVGLSDFGQEHLGDITHVDLPVPDEHPFDAGDDFCVIESLRTTMDCRAPVSGQVTAVNSDLLARPELVNQDPYGQGWLVEMRPDDMADVETLMTADEYDSAIPEEEEE